jgi:uncharacterized protein (TIGR02996 family)
MTALLPPPGFLADILANPGDDLSRLILADWLDDCGQSGRASLIRCQIAHPDWFGDDACLETSSYPYPQEYLDGLDWLKSDAAKGEFGPIAANRWVWNRERDGVSAVYRRGFIGEVRLTLAEFTEGLVHELFTAYPITVVRLTNREPTRDNATLQGLKGIGASSFDWWEESDLSSRYQNSLPAALFTWMWVANPDSQCVGNPSQLRWLEFPTPERAQVALSQACVAYGRKLVGLPV